MVRAVLLNMVLLPAVPAAVYGQAETRAQLASSDAKQPVYDVVSIKPNKSGSGSVSIHSTNYFYMAVNVSLRNILEDAYGIKEDLISGLPKPLADARFDISAKIVDPDPAALSNLTREQQRAMLRPFLRERFQLKVHTEMKQLPVYDLVVMKGGTRFKESAQGSTNSPGTHVSNNRELTAYGISMASFASTLFNQVHRTVIDETNLTGTYDMTLKWSSENDPDAGSDAAPLIFTALQEQLGLKLKPATGPVETLVVDHAEIPTPD